MKKRIFSGVSVAALSLAIVSVVAFTRQGQTDDKKLVRIEHKAIMQSCAKACSDCQRACDTCATHCAHMLNESKKDHLTTLTTCRDCATVCSAASQIVARSGPCSTAICTACAESCSSCAKACEAFSDDAQMKSCAEECRKCEKACMEMLKDRQSTK
jgi:hypothetical protein